MDNGDHFLYWIGNMASAGAIVTTLVGWLPPVAATIAFIWYLIQIYESDTFQQLLSKRRKRKMLRMRHQIRALESALLVAQDEHEAKSSTQQETSDDPR